MATGVGPLLANVPRWAEWGSLSSLSCDCEDCAWNTSTWSSRSVTWTCMALIICITCWTCSVCESLSDCGVHFFPVGGKWVTATFLAVVFSRPYIAKLAFQILKRKNRIEHCISLDCALARSRLMRRFLVAGEEEVRQRRVIPPPRR